MPFYVKPRLRLFKCDRRTVSGKSSREYCLAVGRRSFEHRSACFGTQEHVFFHRHHRRVLEQLRTEATIHREPDPIVVQEYWHDTHTNRSLVHTFERTPLLKLRLSLLAVRWHARSVVVHDRVRRNRKRRDPWLGISDVTLCLLLQRATLPPTRVDIDYGRASWPCPDVLQRADRLSYNRQRRMASRAARRSGLSRRRTHERASHLCFVGGTKRRTPPIRNRAQCPDQQRVPLYRV